MTGAVPRFSTETVKSRNALGRGSRCQRAYFLPIARVAFPPFTGRPKPALPPAARPAAAAVSDPPLQHPNGDDLRCTFSFSNSRSTIAPLATVTLLPVGITTDRRR